MPHPLVLNEVYEVVHRARHLNPLADIVNVEYRWISAVAQVPPTDVTDLTLCQKLSAEWAAAFTTRFPVNYQHLETVVKRVDHAEKVLPVPPAPPLGPNQHPAKIVYGPEGALVPYVWQGTYGIPGDLPQNVALSVRSVPGNFGRWWRSGHRMSPLPLDNVIPPENQLVHPVSRGQWQTAFDNYFASHVVAAGASSALATAVIFSKSFLAWMRPPLDPPSTAISSIQQFQIHDYVATQNTRRAPHNP